MGGVKKRRYLGAHRHTGGGGPNMKEYWGGSQREGILGRGSIKILGGGTQREQILAGGENPTDRNYGGEPQREVILVGDPQNKEIWGGGTAINDPPPHTHIEAHRRPSVAPLPPP